MAGVLVDKGCFLTADTRAFVSTLCCQDRGSLCGPMGTFSDDWFGGALLSSPARVRKECHGFSIQSCAVDETCTAIMGRELEYNSRGISRCVGCGTDFWRHKLQ